MANVPNAVETLRKISIAWVGRTNVTDDRRQTDDRRTDDDIANLNLSSRSLKTGEKFAKSLITQPWIVRFRSNLLYRSITWHPTYYKRSRWSDQRSKSAVLVKIWLKQPRTTGATSCGLQVAMHSQLTRFLFHLFIYLFTSTTTTIAI